MDIYKLLNKLNIDYAEIEHKAVYTIEEALNENIHNRIEGIECKNLFLKSKTKYYLIFMKADKRADLKLIANKINTSKLTFAKEEELNKILNISAGSVTPMGIINDKENFVTVLIDKELEGEKVLVHPNVNTKTISIKLDDLIKIIEYTNHKYIII